EETLALHGLRPGLFVEPFAGGASVALQLLGHDAVERVGLVDLDPLVAAFWRAVFFDTAWLVEQVEGAEVSLERWQALKGDVPNTTRGRAFACLFLNRTSYSGILSPTAGPIG